MPISRRAILTASFALPAAFRLQAEEPVPLDQLDRAAQGPLLDLRSLTEPVIIESMDLLNNGNEYLVRVRSIDGAEGIVATNSGWLGDTYPIFVNRIAPYLVGKDARQIETLLEEVLRPRITYKLQGLALWVCITAAEMALLELLGQVSGKSIGDLFGGVRRKQIAVYRASGKRGNTPEEEIDYLRKLIEETGASAIKFRVGGMLSNNQDSLPGRSEALIPLARQTFGDQMTLYADSNSSYDVENGIRIGRLMQDSGYAFFEEPCRFDDLWETKRVADALRIPIAGGEQEFSLRRFRWTIANRGLDLVQPDLHYFGGYLRSTRVALMAHAMGMQCTPHMSGWGMGYLNALHFMSYIPNAAKHMEFKGYGKIPFQCATSSLTCERGFITVPTGPGFGVEIDPEFVKACRKVTS